jgi:NADH:ubiquinone reductase (H+-translocating)
VRKQVVVVGAGFAGLNAVHELRNADLDITIVDRHNFHTFQPLLYQVATGYLSAEEVGATVRSIFRTQRNVHAVVGEVVGVDWSSNHVLLTGGHTVYFDYLVIAAGGTANTAMIPGMAEHARALYTLDDAVVLRQRLLAELEDSVLNEESPAETTIVVVGGGATGVETAGALASMAKDLIGPHVHSMNVILVEAFPSLLAGFTDHGGKAAYEGLRKRGVDVRLNTKVKEADEMGLLLEDGSRIESHFIIWAAGIQAQDVGQKMGLETNAKRGIYVADTLEVPDHSGVFAVGDVAYVKNSPLPQLAPAAIQTGKHAGKQIKRLMKQRPLQPFHYLNKGNMAVIGRGAGVVQLPGRISFSGHIAWLAWLLLHVTYLVGFRNKLKVMVDWGWNYFTARGASAILLQDDKKK